ncbi:hypothetical protein LCGC14_0750870 [marine sediment metagenome]|uniref:Uncharacterized protein n=1 Tax=marine sediment metagenome TaxID=412755 RepID=A0A0F9Q872_9ZZZZ
MMIMEDECLKCGDFTFEHMDQYVVYLTEKDLANGIGAGDFCKECFQEYQKQENKEYFVKKLVIS